MNRIIWSIYVVGNFLMVTDLRYWWQNHYVGDFFNIQNQSPSSQIGDQHFKLVTNKNCLLHPSPTKTVSIIRHQQRCNQILSWKNVTFRVIFRLRSLCEFTTTSVQSSDRVFISNNFLFLIFKITNNPYSFHFWAILNHMVRRDIFRVAFFQLNDSADLFQV